MKQIIAVHKAPGGHWVGDGFPVRTLFSYDNPNKLLSPFLLLDRAGPKEFAPTQQRRGVGQHPHRGFETVTIVYQGQVAHQDSTGAGGVIGPGDVQWMTAAAGILHEEFHSEGFGREGGLLDMVQLWVNLPAKDKLAPPGYQAIESADIPVVSLANKAGTGRVIAGDFAGHKGPAHTFTPMVVADLSLTSGSTVVVPAVAGWNTLLVVLHGVITINDEAQMGEADLVILSQADSDFSITASSDAVVLLLSGEPIDEPVVGYGPFVMNTEAEIAQAIEDFNRGLF